MEAQFNKFKKAHWSTLFKTRLFVAFSAHKEKIRQTYSVFRPLRPLNMRPCSPVNLFPVNSSSRTPLAPSNTPSRMSLSLLLLRLLQAKHTHTITVLHTHQRIIIMHILQCRAEGNMGHKTLAPMWGKKTTTWLLLLLLLYPNLLCSIFT